MEKGAYLILQTPKQLLKCRLYLLRDLNLGLSRCFGVRLPLSPQLSAFRCVRIMLLSSVIRETIHVPLRRDRGGRRRSATRATSLVLYLRGACSS